MKKRKIIVASLVIILGFLTVLQVQGKTRGYWEYHTYTRTIAVGDGRYHQYMHEGAIEAYAYVVSSTGDCSLTYNWKSPWLKVWITNDDTTSISVTWKECFYVT